MGDGAKLEDSNCAGIGSQADKELRENAAATEEAWIGAGQQPGVEIWRIEKFEVKRWPEEEYGEFYDGDSYIILLTTADEEGEKLSHDIYYLHGKNASIDEQGTAAYKAVELDDLLHGDATQHREVQGHESEEFLMIFPHLHYMTGGVESGFHHVEKEKYEPRMFQVSSTMHSTRVMEVPLSTESMNQGDCFILDAGDKIYKWIGSKCSFFEKQRCNTAAENIENRRAGHAEVVHFADDKDAFWQYLGGETLISEEKPAAEPEPELPTGNCLLKLDGPPGDVSWTEVAYKGFGKYLDSSGVFILDAIADVFIWIGRRAETSLAKASMPAATKYLSEKGRLNVPVKRIWQGKEFNNKKWVSLTGTFTEGFLDKQSAVLEDCWRRFWCVLTPQALSLYTDAQQRKKKAEYGLEKGSLRFVSFADQDAPDKAARLKDEKPFGFILKPNADQEAVYFHADDQRILEEWKENFAKLES